MYHYTTVELMELKFKIEFFNTYFFGYVRTGMGLNITAHYTILIFHIENCEKKENYTNYGQHLIERTVFFILFSTKTELS